jgi:CPA2 family monovalent cation:H+ antiporter-2
LPLGRWWRSLQKLPEPAPVAILPQQGMRKHVIVAGYGRSGSTVARALRLAAVPVVVVELDHRLFESAQARGLAAVWGDITREEVLSAADGKHAQMLILALPGRSTIELAVRHVRHLNPDIQIISKAINDHDLIELRQLGVNVAVVSEFEGGVEMVRQALLKSGRQDADTKRLVNHLRSNLYGELK